MMIGLKISRVVVIEDNDIEAASIIQALNRFDVSALRYNGDLDQLPDKPLDGIRLVFLDVRLGGATGEPRHFVPQTVNVLKKVIKGRSGATGIIYWTAHPEDITLLETQIKKDFPEFIPAFQIRLV